MHKLIDEHGGIGHRGDLGFDSRSRNTLLDIHRIGICTIDYNFYRARARARARTERARALHAAFEALTRFIRRGVVRLFASFSRRSSLPNRRRQVAAPSVPKVSPIG